MSDSTSTSPSSRSSAALLEQRVAAIEKRLGPFEQQVDQRKVFGPLMMRAAGMDADPETLRKWGWFDDPVRKAERYAEATAKREEEDRETLANWEKCQELVVAAREEGWTPDEPFPPALLTRFSFDRPMGASGSRAREA